MDSSLILGHEGGHMKLSLLMAIPVLALALSTACTVESVDGVSSSEALTQRPSVSTCLAPRKHDCSFYVACLEAAKPCGSEGYAVGYGDKYCNRFLANDALSPQGAVWRDETMQCLQTRLGRYLGDASATCRVVLDGAFDDHPFCYTQPHASICNLPATDWISIVSTIDHGDLLSERGRKQIAATARTCLQRWAGLPSDRRAQAASDRRTPRSAERLELEDRQAVVEALSRNPEIDVADLRQLVTTATPIAAAPIGDADVFPARR